MSQIFALGGQSIGASASGSVLPMNIQDWFPLGLTLRSLLQLHKLKASILQWSAFFMIQFSHLYMTIGKTIALTTWTFAGEVLSLLLKMLSRFVIAFLPRSKYLFISWLRPLSTVILEPKKIKSVTTATFSSSICHEVMGLKVFWLSFKPAFSLSSFTLIKKLFGSSSLSAIRLVSSIYLSLLIFLPAILIPAWDSSSVAHLLYSA